MNLPYSNVRCPHCNESTYQVARHVGIIHKEHCAHLKLLQQRFPLLMRRIEKERAPMLVG